MEWFAVVFGALVQGLLMVLTTFFKTDEPQDTTVVHPEPHIKVVHEQDDPERLRDLGL